MCNFLSAIWTRDGRLICQPQYTDRHSELLKANGISEKRTAAPVQNFVRLELTPPSIDEFTNFLAWDEHVDEHEVPGWFDEASRFEAFAEMRQVLSDAESRGKSDGLIFGGLVFVPNSTIRIVGARAWAKSGSNVTAWSGSNVTAKSGSNVTAGSGSNVTAWSGSNVTKAK